MHPQAAANLGLDLREELPKVLRGRAEVVVTRAVVAELRSLGKEWISVEDVRELMEREGEHFFPPVVAEVLGIRVVLKVG